MSEPTMMDVLARKGQAIDRFLKAVEGLPVTFVLRIIFGWMSIQQIEEMAAFQERKNGQR